MPWICRTYEQARKELHDVERLNAGTDLTFEIVRNGDGTFSVRPSDTSASASISDPYGRLDNPWMQ